MELEGGVSCSKLVLFTIFIQQTPFTGGATFDRSNNSALWRCNYEILVWIVYSFSGRGMWSRVSGDKEAVRKGHL